MSVPVAGWAGGLELLYSTTAGPLGENTVTYRVVSKAGGVWAAGATGLGSGDTGDPRRWDAIVVRLNPDGSVLWRTRLAGSANDEAHALAVDDEGNSYIAGVTSSRDFPVKNPFQGEIPAGGQSCGFVAKLSAQGEIVYSTFLCGTRYATVEALAVGEGGSVFLTGSTGGSDFPTTEGAPIRSFPQTIMSDPWAFVARLSPAGDRLLYSTFLGGARGNCVGGSACVFRYASTAASAITVDMAGNAWVTGATTATDFPVTADAYQKVCQCRLDSAGYGSDAFVTKINASGTAWLYSSYLGGPAPGTDRAVAVELDPAGRVVVAGLTNGCEFPTTEGAVQGAYPSACSPGLPGAQPAAFVAAFGASGSRLDFSTLLPGAGWQIGGLLPHWDGSIWLSGARTGYVLTAPFYPNPPRENDFLVRLDAHGTAVLNDEALPPGIGGGALDFSPVDGLVLAGGVTGSVSNVRFSSPARPALTGVSSAAYLSLEDRAAAGERIRLYGFSVGPSDPVGLIVDEGGGISTDARGTRVFVNGVAAALTWAGPQILEIVVPFEVWRDTPVEVELVQDGRVVDHRPIVVGNPRPQLFREDENASWAAALNNDGTVNGPENPAKAGDVVWLYATGLGDLEPQIASDRLQPGTLSRTQLEVTARVAGKPGEVVYAGSAPGLAPGVYQVNVRIPEDAVVFEGPSLVTLAVADVTSREAYVFLRPR